MVTFEIKVFLKAYKRACKLTCLTHTAEIVAKFILQQMKTNYF